MNFNDTFERYHKYIHYLLHSFHIRYHYDEFYQLLLIKLWELHVSFDASRDTKFHSYITYRLRYYLIDLLRQSNRSPQIESLDTADIPLQKTHDNDLLFSIQQWALKLPYTHRHWLLLYLRGYTQVEIAARLNRSTSSIKNYKKATLKALRQSYFTEY
ncbi:MULTISPECIES: sigma-70 family RNA polymerase sigma factor [unclassified Staphylococcus]|uniref:sigma-70 family RNA polymerase sigma factor n=1 Tax=unclassified Staphylococcus TaxID=91994 RepID=UPI0021D2AB5C|nr:MULTISPECIES: sigma-70 family RNA polymerase sigma factor [unclassified Staphylococcus]UXR68899.1 sigma-70 family RNA polymerase sigma factor [Staphylococcus sp. IVB6246]UXR70956.1 sigma-70 family RNA polymerase sigma factor [Staphylococcus sp. IVB6240]UXR73185.1 sigma-70 family RNA polymerase sigma factor [Staphylococcus sp. IVB6238]UXR75483.1 sigma-70 family RNA polymerase sigma factor [Staphylococcus sp. IVB6233]UXR79685.1 sigma-70 family RNA polymerase sigma factor [Staphylococcus sp. I